MVFQSYAIWPHMNVFENIAFPLRSKRLPAAEIRDKVMTMLQSLGLEGLHDRPAPLLSGGQQQRVALGRALVGDPEVLLLDEPFSNLDAALRSRMRTEVKHLHLRLGTTSVFVTHDQEEAMTLSDLIAVMRDGKLIQFGTQNEIYRRPANTYVATFVGKPKMSLLEGDLEHHDGNVEFVGSDIRVGLGSPAAIGLAEGEHRRVAMGIRAEDVRIQLNGADDTPRTFGAQVGLMEPIGSDTFVELAVGPSTIGAIEG